MTLSTLCFLHHIHWGANDTHHIHTADFEVQALNFIATDSALNHAWFKQQYHIQSEMMFNMIKNIIREEDVELLMVEFDFFTFTDNSPRDEIGDGVLLLNMILDDIKPSKVIYVQDLKDKLAKALLQKYNNYVQIA